MTKEEIAGVLEQIATVLELKGENLFKIRVSASAARAIETFGGNISNFQDEEALAKIPGGGAGPCDEAANWMSTFPEGNAIASARPESFKRWSALVEEGAAIDRVGKEERS